MFETRAYSFITKYMCLDCEYYPADYKIVALRGKHKKVALANYYGQKIWSYHCNNCYNKNEQDTVKTKIKKRLFAVTDVIVIGQSIDYDIEVLGLEEEIPKERRIDISKKFHHVEQSYYVEGPLFCPKASLRRACSYYLGLEIQMTKDHDPLEDAKAAMALYRWMETSMDSESFFCLPERGLDEYKRPNKAITQKKR